MVKHLKLEVNPGDAANRAPGKLMDLHSVLP